MRGICLPMGPGGQDRHRVDAVAAGVVRRRIGGCERSRCQPTQRPRIQCLRTGRSAVRWCAVAPTSDRLAGMIGAMLITLLVILGLRRPARLSRATRWRPRVPPVDYLDAVGAAADAGMARRRTRASSPRGMGARPASSLTRDESPEWTMGDADRRRPLRGGSGRRRNRPTTWWWWPSTRTRSRATR